MYLCKRLIKMADTFQNPIDKDKVTDTPHSLEYAHHVGSALIKPEDKGRIKGNAISAMEHQTDQQLTQIYEQMQLLAEQAKKITKRKEISEKIYQAEFRFEPIINHTYHLYETKDGGEVLSVIGPNEWGRSTRKDDFKWQATVKLLADHTWEILSSAE
jgi:predicted transcriptional regulator